MTSHTRRMPKPTATVTIKDVAREAGVALGTVSRILNGYDNVDPALRDRVLGVIEALGYRRNPAARSMRLGKTLAVGCILSDIRQPVAAAMVTAAETVLREAGYAMIVASTHFDDAREAEILAFMRDRAVDGLLMIVNHDSDPATVKRLKALNIPIVLWERDGGGVLDTVVSEHREGLRQATRHLIELGHKNILLIAANPTTRVGREQAGGFADAFAEAGKRPPRHSVFHTEEFDAPKLKATLQGPHRPTAIIANVNDVPDVLGCANDLGLKVPSDLSLISIGDTEFLRLTTPPITCIAGAPQEVGRQATSLLLRRLDQNPSSAPEHLSVPMIVVSRASTKAPADP